MRARTLAALLAAPAALVTATVLAPREAMATKEYAKKEGKDCAFCHVSEKGSGPRNPKGREYEANGHVFGVRSWGSEANEQKFLRASSAIVAQWYAEAARLLDELSKEEKLPGGLALVEGTRDRFKMYARAWLGGARKLLSQGERGTVNALMFLTKIESQYPATESGKEAVKLLDAMAKETGTKDAVAAARAAEKTRGLLLEGRTEFQLGRVAEARALLDKAKADPASKPFAKEIDEALEALPPAK